MLHFGQMHVLLGSLCSQSFTLIGTVVLVLEDVPNMCSLQNIDRGHQMKQQIHRFKWKRIFHHHI